MRVWDSMGQLQDNFEQVLVRAAEREYEKLVTRKAKESGYVLSRREQRRIIDGLKNGTTPRLRCWRFWERGKTVSLGITDEDLEDVDRRLGRMTDLLPQVITDTYSNAAPILADALVGRWPSERRGRKRHSRTFLRQVRRTYGRSLDYLGVLIAVVEELAAMVSVDESQERDARDEAVIRVVATACKVASEVVVLVTEGYASGALARWRTLHELAVVAEFLAGSDVDLSQAFLLHEITEERRERELYRKFHKAFAEGEPPEPDDIEEQLHKQLISEFGSSFEGDYGWAVGVLKEKRATFAAIERYVRAEEFRAPFRTASRSVHPGAAGCGDLFEHLETGALAGGPSPTGGGMALELAGRTLLRAGAAVGLLRPTLDNLIGVRTLVELVERLEAELARGRN